MKTFRIISGLLTAIVLLTTGCYRQDTRTAVLHVPGLHNPQAQALVRGALEQAHGVQQLEFLPEQQQVLVTYDAHVTALRNLELTIASIGLDANTMPATPHGRARLAANRSATEPTTETPP